MNNTINKRKKPVYDQKNPKSIIKNGLWILKKYWFNAAVIAICMAITVAFLCPLVEIRTDSNLVGVRKDTYQAGIQACRLWVSAECLNDLSCEYAVSDTLGNSKYTRKLQEFEALCQNEPEERFLYTIRMIVQLTRDAAALQAGNEYDLAGQYHKKAELLFYELKQAQTEEQLNAIIRQADEMH